MAKISKIYRKIEALKEKIEQFECPEGWSVELDSNLKLVLVRHLNQNSQEIYAIPQVFLYHKRFTNDDVKSIKSMNKSNSIVSLSKV